MADTATFDGGGDAPPDEAAKQKAKRSNLVKELLETEENYVADLKLVVEVC